MKNSIKIHQKICLELFWAGNGVWSMHIYLLINSFFHWRNNKPHYRSHILARGDCLMFQMSWWIYFLQTCSFSLQKTLINGLEWCGSLVDYCDVFINCLDSHSDGTHSLQMRIHWWESDGMQHFTPKSWLEAEYSISLKIQRRIRSYSMQFIGQ